MSQLEPLMTDAERKRAQQRIDRLNEQIGQYARTRALDDPFLIRLKGERDGLVKKLDDDDKALEALEDQCSS